MEFVGSLLRSQQLARGPVKHFVTR